MTFSSTGWTIVGWSKKRKKLNENKNFHSGFISRKRFNGRVNKQIEHKKGKR